MQAITGFGVRGTLARPVPGSKVGAPSLPAPVASVPDSLVTGFGAVGTVARPVIMGGGGTGIGSPTATGPTVNGSAAPPMIEGAAVTSSPASLAVVASPAAACTPTTGTPSLIDIPGISTSLLVAAAVIMALGVYLMETGKI